jgi:hypothetical protein
VSMSTHVIGFVPPDDEWQRMKKIWDACTEADVALPERVEKFFDFTKPDERGQEVDIPHRPYRVEGCEGIEVEIAKLPPNVKVIRFYNSW